MSSVRVCGGESERPARESDTAGEAGVSAQRGILRAFSMRSFTISRGSGAEGRRDGGATHTRHVPQRRKGGPPNPRVRPKATHAAGYDPSAARSASISRSATTSAGDLATHLAPQLHAQLTSCRPGCGRASRELSRELPPELRPKSGLSRAMDSRGAHGVCRRLFALVRAAEPTGRAPWRALNGSAPTLSI